MLFPSIHWKSSEKDYAIVGALPSSLLNEFIYKDGFSSVQQHIRTRLTCPFSTTSTDPRYITHCYDMMANLAASQSDTRLIIDRGLTVGKDKYNNLEVRGSSDSTLLGSVDSKQMVKNLCSSQKYISWSYFLTFTANQSKHFGLKTIRKWIDTKGWQWKYPNYHSLNEKDQLEIDKAMDQASSGLMLRVWEEVSKLFLDFISTSKHSPYKNVKSTFSRREYQSLSGNLGHAHIILEVNWECLTVKEKEFVENLAKGSIFDVIKSEDLSKYKEMGIISSVNEVHGIISDAAIFLPHKCNNRCLVKTIDGGFRCRMPKYIYMSPNCSTQHFIELPVHISDECWNTLFKIGVANPLLNEDGNRNTFKSSIDFFHPKRWVPAVVPGEPLTSPYESITFCICRSMQNCQRLDQAGGCCKYTCKYLGKIDKQNYVKISTSQEVKGEINTSSTYLHNTKITSSNIQQEKEKEKRRDTNHPEGRCISLTEMLHVMLRYPEVYTDLRFVSISTMPLELRCLRQMATDTQVQDGVFVNSMSTAIRDSRNDLPIWRKHSMSEKLLMNDLKQSKMGYDKITQFSLRPIELKPVVVMVGHYYRWFQIDMKRKLNTEAMNTAIHPNIKKTCWIDGLQRQVKLRQNALPELLEWCNSLADENEDVEGRLELIQLFQRLAFVLRNEQDLLQFNDEDREFFTHVKANLIHDTDNTHLPIPVYSFVKPSNSIQFLNHILLSLGRFSTEIDLMTHPSLKDCFRSAKLIGNNNDNESLQQYSNDLLVLYIKEQVRFFPNSMRVISDIIVKAGLIFESVLVKGEIPLTEMPPVIYSTLIRSIEEEIVQERRKHLERVIDAVMIEMEGLVQLYNLPSKNDLMNATLDNVLPWNPLQSFQRGPQQTEESYKEQKLVISTCMKAIDSYKNIQNQLSMVKSICIRGHPGAGKTFCMMYILLYVISQGLMNTPTAKMSRRALQLGGINWDKFLCLRGNDDK